MEFQFFCELDDIFCKKVLNSTLSAGNSLAQVINLKTKIVIQVAYYSFCQKQCSNSTYGWGTSSSQFTVHLEEADYNFMYPQPLTKQISQFSNKNNTNWIHYDVAIDLNHDMYMNAFDSDPQDDTLNGTGIPSGGGYWFSNDSTIMEHQVDLSYVILHEMIHGLGMASSWAPYFSDGNSPFYQLLNGFTTFESDLKFITPSPQYYIKQQTGPTYITGFQPNMIFDKFLYLKQSFSNSTEKQWLGSIGFDMQNFCLMDTQAFIGNFINAFLDNATQSQDATSMYVSMSSPESLTFKFSDSNVPTSLYLTNSYLNQTYSSVKLLTGPNLLNSINTGQLYRPGIPISHLADSYNNTPDFLMTNTFILGKTLASIVEDTYSNIPTIYYNVSTITNQTTVNQNVQYQYKSPIGPGILRILETIGYSTVLTNTNYSTNVLKTVKPDTTCDSNSNSMNAQSLSGPSSLASKVNCPPSSLLSLLLSLLLSSVLL
ncbi:hypothetical protein K501DRAFT_180880 [Backusella circina FSU 941]|nr:hypothetical protein K501DRAFT_180880 [Backusella circina FSU 941]